MSRLRFRRIRGTFIVASTLAFAACYGFRGGGGFPSDIRTLHIEAFDNQTSQAELDQLLFSRLNDQLPKQLGTRPAGAENADAVVRGKIMRYELIGQNYRPGEPSTTTSTNNIDILTYQVTITVQVEIIDRKRNLVVWESQSLVGRGDYSAKDGLETDGRKRALDHILQQIVDGAQSQW